MKKTQLAKMIELATVAHAGQFDKGGNPYILHPLAVMHLLDSTDEELQCIAVGHDLIEDTYVTSEFLKEQGFSKRVIKGIELLTKVEGQSYELYKLAIKCNKDAVKVKMADLLHNSDFRRLKGVTEKDHARLAKYATFYSELKAIV